MQGEKGERFTGRTEDYSRSRPNYPDEITGILEREKAISSDSIVADVGSGTGKLAMLFLEHGYRTICVDPNPEMRSRAAMDLRGYPNASILDGTAENTGLDEHSIDLVVAGQAFHWFDPVETRKEFSRILKPGGQVALIWNDRIQAPGSFNDEYERICVEYSNGYHKSGSQALDSSVIREFFGDSMKKFTMENASRQDLEGIRGRYLSASYALPPSDRRYGEAMVEIGNAFSRHSSDGMVSLMYETRLFLGTPLP